MNKNSSRIARLVRLAKVLNKPELCPIQHGKDAFMTPDKARERNEARKKQRTGYHSSHDDGIQIRRRSDGYIRKTDTRSRAHSNSLSSSERPVMKPQPANGRDPRMASYASMIGSGAS